MLENTLAILTQSRSTLPLALAAPEPKAIAETLQTKKREAIAESLQPAPQPASANTSGSTVGITPQVAKFEGEEFEPPTSNPEHQTIADLQARLIQVERLAAIGELTSTTTHEFNNLLMTILNYAKMGQRNKDDASRDKAFSRILDAANRGAKITSTVLGLARNRSGNLEPTNLVPLIEDTLVLLERELHRYRVQVEKQFETVPNVMAAGNQIQRLMLNLVTNARQAIGEGGTIRIKVAFDAGSNQVVLTVRDSGCGIDPSVLPKIFEPFFTTKNGPDESGKGGTGLGLSACKEIVEQHHGKVRVESTVGKGTAFIIRFPAL